MKLALFTLLLLLPPNYSEAGCVEAVPFKGIGPLKIGDPAPKKLGSTKALKDEWTINHRWFTLAAYRFRIDGQGKIDLIQVTPPRINWCYLVAKKQIMASRTVAELALEFPHCLYEQRYGGETLTCDGIKFAQGEAKKFGDPSPLRIDIENRTLHSIQSEEATLRTQSALRQEWPFRLGFPLPAPR